MRAPGLRALLTSFPSLSRELARLIRAIAHAANDREALATIIAKSCPDTHAYALWCDAYRQCFGYRHWRITFALHAIDRVLGTCGVEPLPSNQELWPALQGPQHEYCNAGDTYATTLIYTRATDTLRIGCWGDIVEKHDRKGKW